MRIVMILLIMRCVTMKEMFMNKILRFAAEKDIFPLIRPHNPFLKSHIRIFCRIMSSKCSRFIPVDAV